MIEKPLQTSHKDGIGGWVAGGDARTFAGRFEIGVWGWIGGWIGGLIGSQIRT